MKKFIISLIAICTIVLSVPAGFGKKVPKSEAITATEEVADIETNIPEIENAPIPTETTNPSKKEKIKKEKVKKEKIKKEKVKKEKPKKEKNKNEKQKKEKVKKVLKDDNEQSSTKKTKKQPEIPTVKKRSALAMYLNPNLDIHEIRASHILVKKRKDAVQIRKDIIAGKISFEEAAMQYSLCPTGVRGGDLGYFNRKRMDQVFSDIAFDLKIGEISDPVGTKFGWHIIKVVDKR